MDDMDALRRELAAQDSLIEQVRTDLYSISPRYYRSLATTALAASVAEWTYRVMDPLYDWQNETATTWHGHLQHVWLYLAGDEQQHYALSTAVAEYLVSPLNHVEGQDGPDDMDRPHTIAAYSAVSSTLHWAVDFAESAIGQAFEAIDKKHDPDYMELPVAPAREQDVLRLIDFVQTASGLLRKNFTTQRKVAPHLLQRLRSAEPTG